jgi:glycosyltransferase involved in cell wall biosynthesis
MQNVRLSPLSKGLQKEACLSTSGSRISVAMITRNEEKAVGKVISDIKANVPGAEIVVVDSSTDRTAEIAESLGARVVRQFPPKGYGPAMDTALHSCAREVIVTLDCDDTYPANYIEPMAKMVLEEGYDLVDGSRLATGKPAAMPMINYFANYVFAFMASVLFQRRVTDLHSGMRAYRREKIEALKYEKNGAALPVELLLSPLREGWKIKIIGIPYRIRIGETTMQPLPGAIWTVKRIWSSRTS